MDKYDPKTDPQFQKPYIDIEEIREDTARYRYVHGGFEGTEARFSFFYPVSKEGYKGRFFHFMAPMQGHEDASIGRTGIVDKIKFAIDNGAYFVETNMGVGPIFGMAPDPTIIYRSSAACAEYSRSVAVRLFGEHRPYGYIYGGSGGGFKSTSCFENTQTWDGACPYIIGTPMAIPCMFTVRALAKRVLRHKLEQIADAVDAGGGDMYAGLAKDEHAVLEEVTKMGFPPKVWFLHKTLDDGALPVLTPNIAIMDPTYYEDFWKLPGYEGADADGTAQKDRVLHSAVIEEIYIPDELSVKVPFEKDARRIPKPVDKRTGADESWKRMSSLEPDVTDKIALKLSSVPCGDDLYLYGTQVKITSGEIAGYAVPLERLTGSDNWIIINEGFGLFDILEKLSKLKPGDEVLLDNSDYIAIQYYHRHQVPDEYYEGFAQFIDSSGKPKYPQRPKLIGPIVTAGGAGSLQSGEFTGKMMNVCTLMDESALPWNPDWYARKVAAYFGDKKDEHHRLWYIDNALHSDGEKTQDDTHLIHYIGALHQALLDVSDWVERGIAPMDSTCYSIKDGQVIVGDSAAERRGIQPTIKFIVNGAERTVVKPGETVELYAEIELPKGAGASILTEAKLAVDPIENEYLKDYSDNLDGQDSDSGNVIIRDEISFDATGVYFPVIRIKSQRNGVKDDIFTQIENLKRARVIVE
ncbi:MAG: hypothetical protein FWH01_03405 [Oscillospiraceae bacterium]|nr:hypothetical protein [Oscillospiraceae bacterium]